MSTLVFIILPFALALGFGALVGLALAYFQLWSTRRAAERATRERSALALLVGMPVRVGLPALVFLLLMKLSVWALVAALVTFRLGRTLFLPAAPQA